MSLLLLALLCNVVADDPAAASKDPSLQTGARSVLVKEVVYDSVVVDIVYVGKSHECTWLQHGAMKPLAKRLLKVRFTLSSFQA